MANSRIRPVKLDPETSEACDFAAKRDGLSFSAWARRLMIAEVRRLRKAGAIPAENAQDGAREVA